MRRAFHRARGTTGTGTARAPRDPGAGGAPGLPAPRCPPPPAGGAAAGAGPGVEVGVVSPSGTAARAPQAGLAPRVHPHSMARRARSPSAGRVGLFTGSVAAHRAQVRDAVDGMLAAPDAQPFPAVAAGVAVLVHRGAPAHARVDAHEVFGHIGGAAGAEDRAVHYRGGDGRGGIRRDRHAVQPRADGLWTGAGGRAAVSPAQALAAPRARNPAGRTGRWSRLGAQARRRPDDTGQSGRERGGQPPVGVVRARSTSPASTSARRSRSVAAGRSGAGRSSVRACARTSTSYGGGRGWAGEQVRGQEQGVVLARVGSGAFDDVAGAGLGRGVGGAAPGRGSHTASGSAAAKPPGTGERAGRQAGIEGGGPPPCCRCQDAAGGRRRRAGVRAYSSGGGGELTGVSVQERQVHADRGGDRLVAATRGRQPDRGHRQGPRRPRGRGRRHTPAGSAARAPPGRCPAGPAPARALCRQPRHRPGRRSLVPARWCRTETGTAGQRGG